MKTILKILVFLLLPFSLQAGKIYSFEDGQIPTNFSAKLGTLSVSNEKAKLGSKALRWDWVAKDSLLAAPESLNTTSIQSTGGITVWIYNTEASNQKLTLWFYEFANSTNRRCSLEVNLNFKGWRYVMARFRPDMGHTGYTLRSMKWEAPQSGNGTLYIDYLEFVDNVSWERISDFQYSLKNNSTEVENYVAIRNTAPKPPVSSVTAEEQQAIAAIRSKLDNWHLGTEVFADHSIYKSRANAFNNYVKNARNRMSDIVLETQADGAVKGPGLYPIDYHNKTIDGVKVESFRNINERYLIQLSYDAIKNNNQQARDLLLQIFDWYYDQGWADGSALGKLRFELLRSSGFFHAAYLMRDAMSAEQFDRVMSAYYWHSMFGKVYATAVHPGENSDQIRTVFLPKLMYAIAMKDEKQQVTALQSFKAYAENSFKPAYGYLDCFKPDFSGYHHRGPYYNAYYPDALYVAALTYYFLSDTPFALNEETYEHLKQSLLTFRFFCAGYDSPGATSGRFPAQLTVLDQLLPAFAYLALSKEQPDPELTQAFMNYWKPTEEPLKSMIGRAKSDICYKNAPGEVEMMLQLAETQMQAEANPVGTQFLPFSGLFVSRHPNTAVTVKGFSKYIWDFESSSSENLYGRYLSNGHVELTNLTTGTKSYRADHAHWDWSHIPGTTAIYLTKEELNSQNNSSLHRNFSDDPFLGGIAFNDNCGVFANAMHDNTFDTKFRTKKTVFRFDSIYTCLGSGINKSSNDKEVHTTLFQNLKLKSSDVLVLNGNSVNQSQNELQNPLLIDNYGTGYVVREGLVNAEFSNSFLTAYINHGSAANNAQYAYQFIPEVNVSDLNNIKQNNPVEILSNNTDLQAVYHAASNTKAMVIYNKEANLADEKLFAVNTPMIVLMRDYGDTLEIAFSDPDMHRPSAANNDALNINAASAEGATSTVELTINGRYSLIADESDGVELVQVKNNQTTIRYTEARDGVTYRVKLLSSTAGITDQNALSGEGYKLYPIGEDIYHIESAEDSIFSLILSNLAGAAVNQNFDLSQSHQVDISLFPSGIYLLTAFSPQGNKHSFKLIR